MSHSTLSLRKEFSYIKSGIQSKSLTYIQILQLKEFEWCIFLILGPQNSPYENFWFRLRYQWPSQYPKSPPKCTFMDRIWNPFVDYETNKICLNILDEEWSPALATRPTILSIISLLSETKISENKDGFANPSAAIQMMKNYPYFCEHAKKISKVSCYKRQNIISNQIGGLIQQQIVEVESHQLPDLIAESLKSKQYNKKPPKKSEQYNQQSSIKCLMF